MRKVWNKSLNLSQLWFPRKQGGRGLFYWRETNVQSEICERCFGISDDDQKHQFHSCMKIDQRRNQTPIVLQYIACAKFIALLLFHAFYKLLFLRFKIKIYNVYWLDWTKQDWNFENYRARTSSQLAIKIKLRAYQNVQKLSKWYRTIDS